MIDDWREIGRQSIAAEAAGLTIANNLLGYKKIIKNTRRQDFQGLLPWKRRKPRESHRLEFIALVLKA